MCQGPVEDELSVYSSETTAHRPDKKWLPINPCGHTVRIRMVRCHDPTRGSLLDPLQTLGPLQSYLCLSANWSQPHNCC